MLGDLLCLQFIKVLDSYADFEGKSTRPDYWWSVLCNVLITLPFGMIAFERF